MMRSQPEEEKIPLTGPSSSPEDLTPTAEDPQIARRRRVYGYIAGVTSMLMFSTGSAVSQALQRSVPHSQLNGLRFTTQGLLVSGVILACYQPADFTVPRADVKYVFLNGLMGIVGTYGVYGALDYIPLGVSVGVAFVVTLAIGLLVSWVVSRVFGWHQVVAAVISVVGVILVIQPDRLFRDANLGPSIVTRRISVDLPCVNRTSSPNATTPADEIPYGRLIGYALSMVEAVAMYILIHVTNTKLSDTKPVTQTFWMSVMGLTVSFIVMACAETPAFPDLPVCWGFLVAHLIAVSLHVILLVAASAMLSPLEASMLLLLMIPFNLVFQYTLLSGLYPGNANVVEIVGAGLVLGGNALLPLWENRRRDKTAS